MTGGELDIVPRLRLERTPVCSAAADELIRTRNELADALRRVHQYETAVEKLAGELAFYIDVITARDVDALLARIDNPEVSQ